MSGPSYHHEFAMKSYDLCDLFSIFNLTAQKLITFPKRFYVGIVGGSNVGRKEEKEWQEKERNKTANDKVSSIRFYVVQVYIQECVCVSVYAPVYKMFSSYFVRSFFLFSFWLFILYVFLPQSPF